MGGFYPRTGAGIQDTLAGTGRREPGDHLRSLVLYLDVAFNTDFTAPIIAIINVIRVSRQF